MKKNLMLIFVFFVFLFEGNAQEDTDKHTVTKNETITQIAQKYRVTPNDIYTLNPKALDGIQENDVLLIPKSLVSKPVFNQVPDRKPTNELINITYIIETGETKYGLSRKYGITIDDIESQNPHIINGLQAGHKIVLNNVRINELVSTTKSEKKYTIEGYKSHFVEPGETLYGISKANGITVDELIEANKSILIGVLKSGQTLQVPIKNSNAVVSNANSNFVNPKEYIVVQGDTKFGLSKRFGVTIEQLENTNPQIIAMLQVGHRLKIPEGSTYVVTNSKPQEEKPISQKPIEIVAENQNSSITVNKVKENVKINENDFVSYEIQPKETLYGLSKKAGMTIDEFIAINPMLSEAVQAGMIIKMPSSANVQTIQNNENNNSNPIIKNSKYIDLTKSINLVEKNQLVLFVPFSPSKYVSQKDFSNINDDFLKQNLEFYQGAQIAIDSAKSLALNFDVKIIETGSVKNNTNLLSKAKENKISTANAVILPFYENENDDIASYLSKENIPVISTSTFISKKSNTNLFEAVPSVNSQRKVMLDYLNSKNGNIIVINDVKRVESKSFIKENAPNAKFLEISERGVFNNENLIDLLDKNKLNFVILDSDKNSIFISSTNVLLGELSNYKIQLVVLEPTLIPDFEDVSRKRFRILKMIYPSVATLSKASLVNNFIINYKSKNNVEPSQNLLFGFDITWDTLLRISQDKSYEASIKDDITEYLELKFKYEKNNLNGYSNKGVYILQYDTDTTIKEVN